jgi:hypothetical protein
MGECNELPEVMMGNFLTADSGAPAADVCGGMMRLLPLVWGLAEDSASIVVESVSLHSPAVHQPCDLQVRRLFDPRSVLGVLVVAPISRTPTFGHDQTNSLPGSTKSGA